MKGIINGKAFEATEFGFDGCHKIYEGWNIGWELKRELEWMKREQLEANGEEW